MIKTAAGEGIQAGLAQFGEIVVRIAAMALCARVTPIEGGAPLYLAMVGASLAAGAKYWALLLGGALGLAWVSAPQSSAFAMLGATVVCGLHHGLSTLPALQNGKQRDALCAGIAGAGMLFAAAPMLRDFPHGALMALLNVAVAMAAAPVLIDAQLIGTSRARLSAEEKMSMALTIGAMLWGLWALPHVGMILGAGAGIYLTMLGAMTSIGSGAIIGVGAGGLLALCGAPQSAYAAMALGGLCAGALCKLGKSAMALCFVAINAICALLNDDGRALAMAPMALLIGIALFSLTAPTVFGRLKLWFAAAGVADADQVIAHTRANTEKKLRALAQLFDALAVGYKDIPALPDEAALCLDMRARLCLGCEIYDGCWSGQHSRAGRLLVALLSDAVCGRVPDISARELPPDICRKCRRANQIPKRLGPMLAAFDEQRRALKQRGECKALMSAQFKMAATALGREADKLMCAQPLSPQLAQEAMAALDKHHVPCKGAWAADGELLMQLRPRTALGDEVIESLSSVLGEAASARALDDRGAYVISAAPQLRAEVGFAGLSSRAHQPNGDSHLACALSDGRLLLALSDGMGSGERAREESTAALRLLKRFFRAGAPCEMALSAVNQVLMLKSRDEMFATIDLCVLDLLNCRARFVKLGSCATLLLRRGRPLIIEGGQLPLGVMSDIRPKERSLRLMAHDLIVMITDGVADSAKEDDGAWLHALARDGTNMSPQRLSEQIVSEAAKRHGRNDDMTVLVARVLPAE